MKHCSVSLRQLRFFMLSFFAKVVRHKWLHFGGTYKARLPRGQAKFNSLKW